MFDTHFTVALVVAVDYGMELARRKNGGNSCSSQRMLSEMGGESE